MGKSRAEKKVKQFIGPFLQDFEKELLGKIDDQLTNRLDKLNEQEEALIQSARDVNRTSNRLRNKLKSFSTGITVKLVGWSFVSAMIGGFITFLLLWYFW